MRTDLPTLAPKNLSIERRQLYIGAGENFQNTSSLTPQSALMNFALSDQGDFLGGSLIGAVCVFVDSTGALSDLGLLLASGWTGFERVM